MHALSHERLPSQAPAGPEMQTHELVQKFAGKGGHGQEENGASRESDTVGDVHGLFHASLAIGTCSSPGVGTAGHGSTEAAARARADSAQDEGLDPIYFHVQEGVFGPHSPRES